jgi:SAM-dependent methyltransferase
VRLDEVLDSSLVYLAWQAPFIGAKVRPFLRHNDLKQLGRVLEVGCGPGTNAQLFHETDYLGIDLNPRYIATARRRFGPKFVQADVREYQPEADARFQTVFMNSLLHHLDDDAVRSLLQKLSQVVSPEGHVHILDLVLPPQRSVARWLAQRDRGEFPRPLEAWQTMFSDVFQPAVFEPYTVAVGGVPLWQMVYFKGGVRHD